MERTAFIYSTDLDLKNRLENLLKAKPSPERPPFVDIQKPRTEEDLLTRLASCRSAARKGSLIFVDADT